jgi:hypothetical protein
VSAHQRHELLDRPQIERTWMICIVGQCALLF